MTETPGGELPLMVHVRADDWAFARRRLIYLEAVLVHVLQDKNRLREWFDAAELAGFCLPGLPQSRTGITRLAKAKNWLRRERTGKGGKRFQYHYASLPTRSFDALIREILDLEGVPDLPEPVPDEAPTLLSRSLRSGQPKPDWRARELANTAPPWILPLMRLARGEAAGNLEAAWQALPDNLPEGVDLPDRDEAVEALIRLGLARGRQA